MSDDETDFAGRLRRWVYTDSFYTTFPTASERAFNDHIIANRPNIIADSPRTLACGDWRLILDDISTHGDEASTNGTVDKDWGKIDSIAEFYANLDEIIDQKPPGIKFEDLSGECVDD